VVVIGHAEELQAGLRRGDEHLARPGVAVGIERVAVKVTARPARLRGWPKRRSLWRPVPHDDALLPRQFRVEKDLDPGLEPLCRDLVGNELPVPGARAASTGHDPWRVDRRVLIKRPLPDYD